MLNLRVSEPENPFFYGLYQRSYKGGLGVRWRVGVVRAVGWSVMCWVLMRARAVVLNARIGAMTKPSG